MKTLRDLRAPKHEAIRYEGPPTKPTGHATFKRSDLNPKAQYLSNGQTGYDTRAGENGGKNI